MESMRRQKSVQWLIISRLSKVLLVCFLFFEHCDWFGIPECQITHIFSLEGSRVAPVGRLDKATSGLLLLTNDNDLNHSIRFFFLG